MEENKVNDLLNKVNAKSKKKWSLNDIKSLAKNYTKNDLKKEQNVKDLIEKVAKAAGVELTKERLKQVKDKLSKLL